MRSSSQARRVAGYGSRRRRTGRSPCRDRRRAASRRVCAARPRDRPATRTHPPVRPALWDTPRPATVKTVPHSTIKDSVCICAHVGMCVYGTTSTRKSSIRGGLNARAACSKALSREEIRFYYSREGVGRMILGTARRLPCYYFASLHFSRGGGYWIWSSGNVDFVVLAIEFWEARFFELLYSVYHLKFSRVFIYERKF